jgi:hypothetical protein
VPAPIKEGIMPFETIAYLAFVISAALVFAAALTYAEWATRHAADPARKPDQAKEQHPHDADPLRKAA